MVTIIRKHEKHEETQILQPKHLEVLIKIDGQENPQMVIMHEDEYNLNLMLSRLADSLKIYPESMNDIWKMIRQYARSEYMRGYSMADLESKEMRKEA
jgi:hypothetical protein